MKKHYKKFCRLLFISALSTPCITEAQITFQKIYPTANIVNQIGNDVIQTADGGYLIASSTEKSPTNNDLDIMIVKTTSMGDTVWTKRYGTSRPDVPNGLLQIGNGEFFVIGYTTSAGGDTDNYLLKLNRNGDTLFTKSYGGFGNEDGKEIVATADGKYVFTGGSNSVNFSDNNMELVKIDSSGSVLWTQYYGGPNYESARSVKLCADGGFIVAGTTAPSTTSPTASVFLVRTDLSGNSTWTKTIGGTNPSYQGKSVVANSDGTYTLCVDDSSATRDSDVRIMNISASGSTINWNKSYGGIDKDICKMIQPTSDGGYIVASISRSFGWVNPDMWILKLTSIGDTSWTRHFGGSLHEHCLAARQTSDGGFIVVGQSRSYSSNMRIFLVKTAPDGTAGTLGVGELASNNIILNIYPNPTNGVVHFDLSDNVYSGSTFRISNSLGQIIFSEIIDQSTGTKEIDLEDKKPGIYFVSIESKDGIATKKLVLQ